MRRLTESNFFKDGLVTIHGLIHRNCAKTFHAIVGELLWA